MCLGIPGKVVRLYDREGGFKFATVEFGGITREVCMDCVPEAVLGDYVIVHVGFALSRLDEAEAERVFSYLSEADQLAELDSNRVDNKRGGCD